MLPTPVSLPQRRTFKRDAQISRRTVRDYLLSRTRFTNLAVLLVVAVAAFCFVLNLHFYFFSTCSAYAVSFCTSSRTPRGILSTIAHEAPMRQLDHLVIVPGHAIWVGTKPELRIFDDEWILEPYQKGGDRVATLFSHITKGARIVLEDPRSLLVFSGGQTRPASTSTEAESYYRLALAADVFQTTSTEHSERFVRATTEEFALDSYQNLLFSIARFHEYTGRFPTQITVVGYEMKSARFVDLHRTAIRWPRERFRYLGLDPQGEQGVKAQEGEKQNGYIPYSLDTYGCHSVLLEKRRQRNPSSRFHSYYTSAPQLAELFDWCPGDAQGGQTTVFAGSLPWDNL